MLATANGWQLCRRRRRILNANDKYLICEFPIRMCRRRHRRLLADLDWKWASISQLAKS